jgi:hypothetical protein
LETGVTIGPARGLALRAGSLCSYSPVSRLTSDSRSYTLILHREETKDTKNNTYMNNLRVLRAFAVH